MDAILNAASQETLVQYGLMAIFGALCIGIAVVPLDISMAMRVGSVGTLFGVTVGLWVSHLIGVLAASAATQSPADTAHP